MWFRRRTLSEVPPPPAVTLEITPDPPGRFASGIPGLDGFLGGGYLPGEVAAFEGDRSSSGEDFLTVAIPTAARFLLMGRGALFVPPAGVAPKRLYERVTKYVRREVFESRARVVDYGLVDPPGPWVVPLAGRGRAEALRAMVSAERAVVGSPRTPFVELTALDTLESVVGAEAALRMLAAGTRRTREVGNLGLLWSRSGSPASELADYRFTLARRPEGIVIGGLRPSFPPCPLLVRESAGVLRVDLGLPRTDG